MKRKVAFLDRDGTINRDYPDEKWSEISYPELLPGSMEGLKELQKAGYDLIIVTNQYIIADGIISLEQYKSFNEALIKILKSNGIDILKTYFCPHNDFDNCNCKKPKTGLIEMAMKDFDIDIKNSIYIGDSLSDYELSKKFNLDFYGIRGINDDEIFKYSNLREVAENLKKPMNNFEEENDESFKFN